MQTILPPVALKHSIVAGNQEAGRVVTAFLCSALVPVGQAPHLELQSSPLTIDHFSQQSRERWP
jgi:hypothetical protein